MSKISEVVEQDFQDYRDYYVAIILERFEEIFGYKPRTYDVIFRGNDVIGHSVSIKVDDYTFGLMHDDDSGRDELATNHGGVIGWRYVRRPWTLKNVRHP